MSFHDEELIPLLSMAQSIEMYQPEASMTDDYWQRLKELCQRYRANNRRCENIVPNETKRNWKEAVRCLEQIQEMTSVSEPSEIPGNYY